MNAGQSSRCDEYTNQRLLVVEPYTEVFSNDDDGGDNEIYAEIDIVEY